MSYSQFGQDLWVLSYFKKGTFVDIGFNDGKCISNTCLLEENGWSGLGIDPFPKNYECRKNTIIEKSCVHSENKNVVFTCAQDLGGIKELLLAHKNTELVKNSKDEILPANTLEFFLEKHKMPQKIEYLSMDTEGSEFEILSVFPFDKYKFGCITYEHNGEWIKREKIKNLLESKGYSFVKELVVDDCFIHESTKNNNF
jgi:FkbM family methyltransferase